MKKLLTVCAALMLGCASQQKYVEGTTLQLGAYVPWQSNLYGVELMSYVNGCVVKTSTNCAMYVERDHSASNTYLWGMVEVRENTKTTVSTTTQAVSPAQH